MPEEFEVVDDISAPWGMCKDDCGRPRNKWTSYCNTCYNRRKKERYAQSQAKRFVAKNTEVADIPVELLQATVTASQEEIITLRTMLEETRTDVGRLCDFLGEYRPDLAEHFLKKNGLRGGV
jgi:hypothetical protein